MVRPRTSPQATPILQLLSDYSFDVDTYAAEAMVTGWLQRFEPTWVSQAITEALYQGRYKLVSVDHILQIWQRRGQPLRHFNREFESIILGQSFNQIPAPAKPSPAPLNFTQEPANLQDKASHNDGSAASPTAGRSVWEMSVLPSALGHSDVSAFSSANAQPWEPGSWITAAVATTADSTTDETEIAAPTWPSARTIPPLTPDQLARLTQPAPTVTATTPGDTATVDPPPTSKSMDLMNQESLSGESLGVTSPEAESPETAFPEVESADNSADSMESPELEPSELAKAETSTFNPAPPSATVPEDKTTSEDEATLMPMGQTEPDTPAEAIPNFQPITSPAGFTPESTDAIPPFVPAAGPSGLHQRLKAVVEAGLTDN